MNYWLLKSEPNTYSIDDLAKEGTDYWDGVRNYQARNFLRDQMKIGDLGFFYHSNCKEPGIVGVCAIAKEGYPDTTAFDPKEHYYDPKSDPKNPRWYRVDVHFRRKLSHTISLKELKSHDFLAGLPLVRRGNRLSIMPVSKAHWDYILTLEASPANA